MRALLGLVEVAVDTYVEYQRQDENHMGDSTPRRTPALGRLQPKSVFSIWDAKSENLGRSWRDVKAEVTDGLVTRSIWAPARLVS